MSSWDEGEIDAGTSVGQYQLRRRVGAGGMAEVYEAIHTGLNKRVAIKILRRQFIDNDIIVKRFLREGRLASRLRHPHVVDVTDVGMIDGLPCLVMEYLDGEALRDMLRRETRVTPERAASYLLPVIAAVSAAHALDIVHRDLKPANIFLSRLGTGEIASKVLDFGISKVITDPLSAQLTTDSTFLGSPHYVSPELARGEVDIGPAADQFSLGVILYECLTGVRPFAHKGHTFMALMGAIAEGDFTPPREREPSIPVPLEAVVLRAMALRPKARYPSARHLGASLLPFADERTRLIWSPAFAETIADERRTTDALVAEGPMEHSAGTALGQSISEFRPHPRAEKPSSVLGVAAACVIGVLLAGFGYLATRHGATEAPSTETAASTSAEAPSATAQPRYSVLVLVEPPHAGIEFDGKWAGVGTFERKLPLDGMTHRLRITATGYEDQEIVFRNEAPPRRIRLTAESEQVKRTPLPRPTPLAPRPQPAAESSTKTDVLP